MSKLDELREKLNDGVQDLMSKLPFGKKTDDLEDQDFDDTGEFSSEDLQELNDQDATGIIEDEEDEEDKEIKKGLKKQMLIRGGLVLLLVLLAAEHFLNKDDGGQSADDVLANLPDPKKKKDKKRKRKKAPEAETAAVGADDKNIARDQPESQKEINTGDEKGETTGTGGSASTSVADAIKEQVQNIATDVNPAGNNLDEDNPLALEPQGEKDASGIPPETPSEVLSAESNKIEEMESLPDLETLEPIEDTDTTPKVGQQEIDNSPKKDSNVKEAPSLGMKPEQDPAQKQNEKSIDAKMMDSIKKAKEKEYVAPPNYENIGRGLVYNCRDKHWSCVNRKAFLACRDNYAWSKANKKSPECAIKNVYANDGDCKKVQQYYVDNLMMMDKCSN